MGSFVRLRGLTRQFPAAIRPAVSGLDLDVGKGETLVLVGPSGCGKSTTLRMVAGLDSPNEGSIEIGGRTMRDTPPQDRDVAMVFQGFALYPHMKVREILEFPLRMRRVPRPERLDRTRAAAEMLEITHLMDRRPGELSGGEQQRVAMGRAIVRRPQVFLFDEPLSNLDPALRALLRVELRNLLKRLGATALYVTHDQAEAMTLGDRIAVLRAGELEQIAKPEIIYEKPATAFVASFFGTPPMNLLPIQNRQGQAFLGETSLGAHPSGDREVWLGIRPEDIRLGGSEAGTESSASVGGVVTAVEPQGAETHLGILVAGVPTKTRIRGFRAPDLDATVTLHLAMDKSRWFDRSTGRAL